MNEEIEPLEEYPRWREVLKHFLAAQFKIGDLVSYDWLYDQFQLERPAPGMDCIVAEKIKLAFLGQITQLRDELLEENNIDLKNVIGQGYTIIAPQDQTSEAYTDGIVDMRRALRKMIKRTVCVDMAQLTDEQRRDNALAQSKLSALRSMIRKTNRLLGPRVEEE